MNRTIAFAGCPRSPPCPPRRPQATPSRWCCRAAGRAPPTRSGCCATCAAPSPTSASDRHRRLGGGDQRRLPRVAPRGLADGGRGALAPVERPHLRAGVPRRRGLPREDHAALGRTPALRRQRLAPRSKSLLDTSPLRALLGSAIPPLGRADRDRRERRGGAPAGGRPHHPQLRHRPDGHLDPGPRPRDLGTPARRSAKARIGVEHVMASAALPLFFPAVRIGSSWYGDGGIRLLDAARARASTSAPTASSRSRPATSARSPRPTRPGVARLPAAGAGPRHACSTPSSSTSSSRTPPTCSASTASSSAPRPSARRRGLRPIDMLILQPSEDLGKIAADYSTSCRAPRLPDPRPRQPRDATPPTSSRCSSSTPSTCAG